MRFHQATRKAFILALVLSFTLSGLIPNISAQRRRSRTRAQAQIASTPRKQMSGTEHQRPPRTYDVQHYIIRTRFDVPNKTVYGDETVVLKPLSSGFQTFELDATGIEFE